MKDIMEVEEIPPQKNKGKHASVFDAFDLLRSHKEDCKLTGGFKIIALVQSNENRDGVEYPLRRLVRSLGANIPELRTGYFATLVNFLSSRPDVTVVELLALIKKELHASGGSKSEVGDVALGQILVCGAIFRSGLMLQSSQEDQQQVLQTLLTASSKKSYLSTAAYLILLDFVNQLNPEQFSSIIWSNIKKDFKKDISEHSTDTLYFLMMAAKKFPEQVKLRKLMGITNIICNDTVQAISEKLMAGIDFNSVNHPIYKEVAIQVSNSEHLSLFWTCVDSQLVKHNRNRELVAINILTNIFDNIKENLEVIPSLLSKNFFKLFIDWFKGLQTASRIRNKRDDEDDQKLLIKKEKLLLNSLTKAMKNEQIDDKLRVEVLKKLLFNPGEMNFTEITGTNVVKSIVSDLQKDGVVKMSKLLKKVLLNTSKKTIKDDVERSWFNNERLRAAELISYLVSHESVKDDTEFKLTYMRLLMCFGFFKIGGDDEIAVSSDLAGSIKTCFYRCFSSRFSNVDSLLEVLAALASFISTTIEKEQIRNKIEKQFPKENMECWQLTIEICQKIEKTESKSKVEKVFLILLYQLGLFLFSEPTHVKMARESIKELKSCFEHYRKGKKKSNKTESTEDEPEWIEVLVEVLLSILSTESSVLRSVVQCVFRLLWEYLTPSSVGQIVSVLDPESENDPLTQDSDSDESDEETEKNGDVEGEDEEKSEKESEDEEEDDDDDDDVTVPDQLRMAVQKALGGVAESDTESIDADKIDEDEGKKLDEALAEAFKQYQLGKGKKTKKERKNKKMLSDFRIRVLDLVDIYLEKDPAMDICLSMIGPLMRAIEFSMQDTQFNELEKRLRKTVKNLTKVKKFSSTNITMDVLCDYLRATIDKGTRSHFVYQALGDIVTQCALFIIHCSQRITSTKSPKKSKASPLTEIIKENVNSYFNNRNCLLPVIFFHNILQCEWEDNYDLIPVVIDNVFSKTVRQFRRNEGLDLLAGFYRALKRTKPTSEKLLKKLSHIEKHFDLSLRNTLKSDENEFKAKKNYFVTLKKLINTMNMFHESCAVQSDIDFKLLLDVVDSCKGTMVSKNNNNTQQNHNQGTDKKKKKKNKKKKRKHEDTNGHSESGAKRIKNESESQSD